MRSPLQYYDADVGDVTIIHFSGKITLGAGTAMLREAVESVLARGRGSIVLDFAEISYVDSVGLGTLVSVYTQVKQAGGQLKLMKLRQITRDLIQITRLYSIFEVFSDQKLAVASFK